VIGRVGVAILATAGQGRNKERACDGHESGQRGRGTTRRWPAITEPKGPLPSLAYDAMDRTTRIAYPGDLMVTYAYDTGGNVVTVNDTNNTTYASQIAYNASGKITSIVKGNAPYHLHLRPCQRQTAKHGHGEPPGPLLRL
jgi:YD repeat-containing protein